MEMKENVSINNRKNSQIELRKTLLEEDYPNVTFDDDVITFSGMMQPNNNGLGPVSQASTRSNSTNSNNNNNSNNPTNLNITGINSNNNAFVAPHPYTAFNSRQYHNNNNNNNNNDRRKRKGNARNNNTAMATATTVNSSNKTNRSAGKHKYTPSSDEDDENGANSKSKRTKRGRKKVSAGIELLRVKLELFDDETSMSLLHIMHRFEEESIDFQVFLALTEDDMKELGLKMGDRKRVAMAQAYFTNQQTNVV